MPLIPSNLLYNRFYSLFTSILAIRHKSPPKRAKMLYFSLVGYRSTIDSAHTLITWIFSLSLFFDCLFLTQYSNCWDLSLYTLLFSSPSIPPNTNPRININKPPIKII
ncbi:hypothetical protein FOPPYZMZ_CDS0289 [Pseudomonas phage 9Ps-7B]|nr:hypothetical protein IPCDMZAV_CDS0201 [Pseudomonas phage 6B]WRQ06221.1 hypothetical protein QAMIJHJT_CDS0290 [Pseudomonas phage 9-Ps-8B]WRQ06629.1 hypothetical protein FOPPYZMZ_CDS0289 [Pseudomonas phage 9Ps-7B]WRQ06980.1 hypothetical protein ZBUARNPM_CDS0231 [Pseudomonas phage 14Ps5-6]